MIKETAYEDNIPGWNDLSLRNSIKYVVFDPSFAGARPTITDFWFDNMFNLESITGLNYLNTEEVTSMRCMFCECQKLKSIDLSNFNTANVTNMAGMFMNSENLKNIYVGDDWSTAAVTNPMRCSWAVLALWVAWVLLTTPTMWMQNTLTTMVVPATRDISARNLISSLVTSTVTALWIFPMLPN